MVRGALNGLASVNSLTCVVSRNLAGVMLMAMVVIVMLQVVFRYLLNDSLTWTEEVARTMMVWTAFLVAPWAYRLGANIGIDLFVDELSVRVRLFLTLFLNMLICWILLVFFIESFGLWNRGLSVRADSLPIQVAWFYTVIPVALFLMLLVSLELMLRNLFSLIYPDEDFSLPKPDELMEGE